MYLRRLKGLNQIIPKLIFISFLAQIVCNVSFKLGIDPDVEYRTPVVFLASSNDGEFVHPCSLPPL